MDRNALGSWIQVQHLSPETVASYCSAFQSRPSKFHVIDDFLLPEIADRLSDFLRTEAQFEPEYGLYSAEEQKVDEETWSAAPEEDRFFRYGRLVGTPPNFQFSANSLTYLKFRTVFQTDEGLRGFFEDATGLTLAQSEDFGSHSMGIGDFLKEHDDNNRDRRLALVLYLSPGWSSDYGGNLHIVDREGNQSMVEPKFNSIVAFDTLAGTTHYVDPVTGAVGRQRRVTIGGWYHNP